MLIPTILVISAPGLSSVGTPYIQFINGARANMRQSKPVILVHGGAGDWPSELHKRGLNGVRKAADRGFRMLSSGGSALDAVEVTIVSLEDDAVFNAGTGSTLNLRGEIETDAAIMDGKTLRGAG